MDKISLKGKTVAICGGAGFIGKALVENLLSTQTNVLIIDKVPISIKHKHLLQINIDVWSPDFHSQASKFITENDIKITGWVNSIYPHTQKWDDLDFLNDNGLGIENITLHLGGYYKTSQLAIESLIKNRGGSLVNLSSIYGSIGPDFSIYEGTGMTNPAPYAAIKGGIQALTRYLAIRYADKAIRANCVCPGGVKRTDHPEKFVESYCKKVPLNRMCEFKDITGAVAFLLSDSSSYITGQNITVDGGFSIL